MWGIDEGLPLGREARADWRLSPAARAARAARAKGGRHAGAAVRLLVACCRTHLRAGAVTPGEFEFNIYLLNTVSFGFITYK